MSHLSQTFRLPCDCQAKATNSAWLFLLSWLRHVASKYRSHSLAVFSGLIQIGRYLVNLVLILDMFMWKWKCTKHSSFGRLLEVEMSTKCTPSWREANLQVKMYKVTQVRATFGSWDVEKVHAVVARSTFGSEHVESATCSDYFWTSRCRSDVQKVHVVVARNACASRKC